MNRASYIAAVAAILGIPLIAGAHGMEGHHADHGMKAQADDGEPFGRPGNPAKIDRTIKIGMTDSMRYEPAEIHVRQGETVKLVVTNHGRVLHELVLGTMDELKEHAALMRKFPAMEHAEPSMAEVKPGKREELVWNFDKPGQFFYACLVPGHYEAGMIGKIVVTSR